MNGVTMQTVCTRCGHVGEAISETPGSIWIEAVLYLFFIVPGLIYSIWRINKRHDVCRDCGHADLIPAGSRVGRAFIAANRPDVTLEPAIPPPSTRSISLGRALGRAVRKLLR
jgi:hypothetical protein